MGSVATWDDEILDQRCTVPVVARWNRATVISCAMAKSGTKLKQLILNAVAAAAS